MKQIRARELEFAIVDRGEGPPVLLVHGFPLHHAMWSAQVKALIPHCRVIAPDLRGFGQSNVTPGTTTMEDFADDLAAILDELGVDSPVALCGFSMGGYIAFAFWRRYADRVRSLVLMDTRSAADAPEAAQARLATAEQVLENGPAVVVDAMTERLFASRTREAHPAIVEEAREIMACNAPDGIAAALRGMAERSDATGLLAEITAPTLVLAGSDDVISPPEEMRSMARALPAAQFVEISGAGHMAPMEQPVAVNDVLVPFVRQVIG